MAEQFKRHIILIASVCLLCLRTVIPHSLVGSAVCAVLAFVAFMRPKIGIYLLLIYFPFRSMVIEFNPAMKIAGDVIILAAFMRVVWMGRKDIPSLFKFSIFEWAFFAFIGIGSISAILSDVSLPAIIFQIRAFVITYLLFYIVKRVNIEKTDVRQFIWITILVAAMLTIQGLVEKMSLRTLLMPEAWVNMVLSPNNKVRIYGLINNPNRLAIYLTFAIMFFVYVFNKVPKGKKLPLTVLAVFVTGTWLLTYSRGTWLAFCIGLAVYWLLTRYTKRAVQSIVLIAISFVAILYPVTQITQWVEKSNLLTDDNPQGNTSPEDGDELSEKTRMETTFDKETIELSKSSGRLFIVKKGLEVFKDHLIIGTGFATFGDSATKSYSSPIYKEYDIPPNIYSDNQYIQVMAQTGILGVIAFAVFLLGMLGALWKNRTVNKDGSFLMISILLGIFFLGLLYNIWEDKTFTIYYFPMLAYVLYHQRQLDKA